MFNLACNESNGIKNKEWNNSPTTVAFREPCKKKFERNLEFQIYNVQLQIKQKKIKTLNLCVQY